MIKMRTHFGNTHPNKYRQSRTHMHTPTHTHARALWDHTRAILMTCNSIHPKLENLACDLACWCHVCPKAIQATEASRVQQADERRRICNTQKRLLLSNIFSDALLAVKESPFRVGRLNNPKPLHYEEKQNRLQIKEPTNYGI